MIPFLFYWDETYAGMRRVNTKLFYGIFSRLTREQYACISLKRTKSIFSLVHSLLLPLPRASSTAHVLVVESVQFCVEKNRKL